MSAYKHVLFATFLYGLESVPISNANLCTLQSTSNVALYKIFKLKYLSNLYYVQHFMGTLPVTYALDLRKLNFLQKQSVHRTSVINLLFSLTASASNNYSVIQPLAHWRLCACVWHAFIRHLAVASF